MLIYLSKVSSSQHVRINRSSIVLMSRASPIHMFNSNEFFLCARKCLQSVMDEITLSFDASNWQKFVSTVDDSNI